MIAHPKTVEQIAADTLSGRSYLSAWSTIVSVLDDAVPGWCDDGSKSPVENATAAIRKLAERAAK